MASDDPRTRLLHAAGPIFAEKGYEGATVREICQSAGVNLASVNYHFRDKERLYIETVKLAHRRQVEQAPLPDWPPGMSPEEKLRVYIRNFLARLLDAPSAAWQLRLMMREILKPSAACRELVEDYFRPHFRRLQDILDELLPEETALHVRSKIGFSIVGQCVHYRVASGIIEILLDEEEKRRHFHADALAEHIARFSLAAVGAGPPLGCAGPDRIEQSRTKATSLA